MKMELMKNTNQIRRKTRTDRSGTHANVVVAVPTVSRLLSLRHFEARGGSARTSQATGEARKSGTVQCRARKRLGGQLAEPIPVCACEAPEFGEAPAHRHLRDGRVLGARTREVYVRSLEPCSTEVPARRYADHLAKRQLERTTAPPRRFA